MPVPPRPRTARSTRMQLARYDACLAHFAAMLAAYVAPDCPIYIEVGDVADAPAHADRLDLASLFDNLKQTLREVIGQLGDRVVLVASSQEPGDRTSHTDVIVAGAVAEFDRDARSGARVGCDGDTPVGAASSHNAIHPPRGFVLDLQLVEPKQRLAVPCVRTLNSMQLVRYAGSRINRFSIFGGGFHVAGNTRHLPVRLDVARLLVTLSVIQLIGRYARVPYWRCIPGAQPDPMVVAMIKRTFTTLRQSTRVAWLQKTLLAYCDAWSSHADIDRASSLALHRAIASLGRDPKHGWLDADLFVAIYAAIPIRSTSRASGEAI